MNRIIFILILSGILVSCGQPDKKTKLEKLKQKQSELVEAIATLEKELESGGNTGEAAKARDVAVIALSPQPFRHFIEVQGSVDGDENVSAGPKIPGTVSRILVEEGDEVTAGQILVELDNSVLLQGMEELKTQLAFADNMFRKQQSLWEQKIGTEVQFLTAKNNKEIMEHKLATLQEQLELSRITSPIAGTVDAIDIKVGQAVMPGLHAVRVVSFNKLKVTAEVPENYAQNVKKGNNARIFFPDLDREIDAQLSYAAKVINSNTRTFTVDARITGDKDGLHPNMIALLKINDYQSDSALVIPINLIQHSESVQYVYVAESLNGTVVAKKKEIQTGRIYNGKVEIISGLAPNDKLITAAYLDVADGMTIKY